MSAKPERVSSAARAVPPTCCGEPMKMTDWQTETIADQVRVSWRCVRFGREACVSPHLVLIDRVNAKLASLKAERHDWCPH
jgi:hypothetical protein